MPLGCNFFLPGISRCYLLNSLQTLSNQEKLDCCPWVFGWLSEDFFLLHNEKYIMCTSFLLQSKKMLITFPTIDFNY